MTERKFLQETNFQEEDSDPLGPAGPNAEEIKKRFEKYRQWEKEPDN